MASDDRTVDASTESARAHAFCGGDDDGGGDDALGRLRREHGAMYARMRSMLDEDAREARTRKRLRRALVEEFPEFDAYAIDVAVAWDDARCATLARVLVETPTAEDPFGDERSPVTRAAAKGLKERLKFLHEHGYAWDAETCMYAAENGHLECLKYAHEHGCAWDEETCRWAAGGGHLECLKYAHEHGCAWNERTCWQAIQCVYQQREDRVENAWNCLSYAIDHQCPGYVTYVTLLRLERDAQAAETSFIVNLALSHAQNGYIPEREYAEPKAELERARAKIDNMIAQLLADD